MIAVAKKEIAPGLMPYKTLPKITEIIAPTIMRRTSLISLMRDINKKLKAPKVG